jgi:hypothetical protein
LFHDSGIARLTEIQRRNYNICPDFKKDLLLHTHTCLPAGRPTLTLTPALSHGVTAAQEILVLSVQVRILVGQHYNLQFATCLLTGRRAICSFPGLLHTSHFGFRIWESHFGPAPFDFCCFIPIIQDPQWRWFWGLSLWFPGSARQGCPLCPHAVQIYPPDEDEGGPVKDSLKFTTSSNSFHHLCSGIKNPLMGTNRVERHGGKTMRIQRESKMFSEVLLFPGILRGYDDLDEFKTMDELAFNLGASLKELNDALGEE